MVSSDNSGLFSRIQELRSREGKGWKEIANILEEEGYEENGKALTDNALRKRYAKWSKTQTRGTSLVESEPESAQEPEEIDFDRFRKGQTKGHKKKFEEAALPVPSEKVIAADIANLVSVNNQLLEQIQQSNRIIERLEKRLDDQEQQTRSTDHDTEEPVTSRDLLELLREFGRGHQMKFIEENKEYDISREEVRELIDGLVEEKVESELKSMLSEEGSFSEALTDLVDHRLKALFSGDEPVARAAKPGPGRGKRGKTHKKFSASLEEGLFERVRSLPGQFSGHLANALEVYLSVIEQKTTP